MSDWGSSTLDNTTAGNDGILYCIMVLCIALCWYWQCLLTVDGNVLLHIVTPLDVITVARCCRQTQDVLHPAGCPPAALQTSEWQWTASDFTVYYCTRRNSRLLTADKWRQHYLTLCLSCWTRVPDQFVSWYSPLPYINQSSCQSVLHITVVHIECGFYFTN